MIETPDGYEKEEDNIDSCVDQHPDTGFGIDTKWSQEATGKGKSSAGLGRGNNFAVESVSRHTNQPTA